MLATVALVGGCTGSEPVEPEPAPRTTQAPPEPTEDPAPSEDPSVPEKPERPAAMERDDAEGAAAAAVYFVELYPYVMATGDTAEWELMSYEGCLTCAEFIEQATTIAENGDVFTGGVIESVVDDPGRYVRDEATGIYPLDFGFTQAAMSITSSSGESLFTSGATKNERRIEMALQGGEWVVVEIGRIPGGHS